MKLFIRPFIIATAACFPLEIVATGAKLSIIVYSVLVLPLFLSKRRNDSLELLGLIATYFIFVAANTRDIDYFSIKILFNLAAIGSLIVVAGTARSSISEMRVLLMFAIIFLILRVLHQNVMVVDKLPIYQTQVWNFSYVALASLNGGIFYSVLIAGVAGVRSFTAVLVAGGLAKGGLSSPLVVIVFSFAFGASTIMALLYLGQTIDMPGSMSWRFWHWSSLISLLDDDLKKISFGLGNGSSWRYLDDLNLPYLDIGEVKDTHSHYIKILIDQGLVGLSAYMAFVYLIVRSALKGASIFVAKRIYLILFIFLSAGFYDDGVFELNLFWAVLFVYVNSVYNKNQAVNKAPWKFCKVSPSLRDAHN